jgi:hypothetical protein
MLRYHVEMRFTLCWFCSHGYCSEVSEDVQDVHDVDLLKKAVTRKVMYDALVVQ